MINLKKKVTDGLTLFLLDSAYESCRGHLFEI